MEMQICETFALVLGASEKFDGEKFSENANLGCQEAATARPKLKNLVDANDPTTNETRAAELRWKIILEKGDFQSNFVGDTLHAKSTARSEMPKASRRRKIGVSAQNEPQKQFANDFLSSC